MKSLYRLALTHLPRPLLIRMSYVFSKVAPILYKGDKVKCPVCEKQFSKFLSYGSDVALRNNVLCPSCLSLERHRLIWLYLKEDTNIFTKKQRLLHIAPEQCFHSRLQNLKNLEYITGDLESPLAEYHFDLHQIPFENNSFDVFMCNHVLEHVKDYHRCAAELNRVLKPGGWGIMQVPIDYSRAETYEDPSIVTPEEREKHYWQKDHLRLFGRDYPDILRKAGFIVEENRLAAQMDPDIIENYRLQKQEILYVCRK